jgi:serine/threonine protein kinase
MGLATRIDDREYIFVRCGTPGFIAPEILKIKEPTHVRLGVESDMFSLGAIYYRLLYGKQLFAGKEQREVLASNRACHIRLQESPQAACGEMELLRGMLELNPCNRITPEEALRSPFVRERRRSTRIALQSLENAHLPTDWNCIEY